MKRLLLLLIATMYHFSAHADYEPTLLADLIDSADLIMYGEITTAQGKFVTAEPLQILKGSPSVGSITIEKFENWTCASRFAAYKTGQREIFFLKKHKSSKSLSPLGAANEGEMPVVNDKVYYKQQYLALDKSPKQFKVYGGIVNGYTYNKFTFLAAITSYLHNRIVLLTEVAKNQESIDTTSNPVLLRILNEYHGLHFRTY